MSRTNKFRANMSRMPTFSIIFPDKSFKDIENIYQTNGKNREKTLLNATIDSAMRQIATVYGDVDPASKFVELMNERENHTKTELIEEIATNLKKRKLNELLKFSQSIDHEVPFKKRRITPVEVAAEDAVNGPAFVADMTYDSYD